MAEENITEERAFQQIGPVSIGTQLYRHLHEAIIRGELRPGQALSETEISKKYSVSRQPVREAFIKLAEERLVMVLPQRGVIPPFLTAVKSRGHAARANFCLGVMPPRPMLGRS